MPPTRSDEDKEPSGRRLADERERVRDAGY
jgi:hypothetical protein